MAYAFPELSIPDIALQLNQLFNLPVDESFLKKPDPTQWQKMLSHLLCVISECPEDTFLKQPSLTAEFEHLELHIESIPVMHLVLAMQIVMHDIECSDFTAGDIFKPAPNKVKRICSALVNFACFKEMRLPDIEQIKADTENEKESYFSLQKENEELKQKINQIKARRAEQEPELNKIKDEIERRNMKVDELMQTKAQAQKGITDAKTIVTENIAKADELKSQLLRRKEEVEMLSQKIVHSPTKVRAEQDGLNQQVQMLGDTQDRKRQRLGELHQQIGIHQQRGASAEIGLTLLEAINSSVNKENEIQKENDQLEDKIQDLLQQDKEVKARRQKLLDTNQSKQEKLAKLSCQHQSRMNVLAEHQDILNKDKEEFLQKQDSNSAKRAKALQCKKRLETEDKKEQKLVESKIEAMQDLYSQLLDRSDVCHTNIGTYWKKTRSLLNQLNGENV